MSNTTASTTPVPASSLRDSSERAAYKAMFELLDGSICHRVEGELVVDTEEGRYRFIDGVCFGAPADDAVGASIAGWLIESDRASAVITRWRCGARAVLARDGSCVRVSGTTVGLHHDGSPVDDGFATHEGRLVFAHESDARAPAESADPPDETTARRPPSYAAPPAWVLPPMPRMPRPSLPRAFADSIDDEVDTCPRISRRTL